MKLLEIKDLKTIASDDPNKQILKGLNLTINEGEIHVIMGPNGSGKSTLANTCLSSPKYIKTDGSIIFNGEDITNKTPDYIAKKGLFMSFQTPIEIPGITLANYLKTSKKAITSVNPSISTFYKDVNDKMKELNMDESYLNREFNVGFSGGEKKKNEILQMLLLNPKLVILDEIDSGLDVDAIKMVSKGINMYKNSHNAILIITHSTRILQELDVTKVHILVDGKIVSSNDSTLAEYIEEKGYTDFIKNEN